MVETQLVVDTFIGRQPNTGYTFSEATLHALSPSPSPEQLKSTEQELTILPHILETS